MPAIVAYIPFSYSAPSPVNAIVIAALVGFVVLLLVIVGARRPGGQGAREGMFNRTRFRQFAADHGLDPEQTRVLEALVRKYRPPNPYAVFDNLASLDALLRKALAEVDRRDRGSEEGDARTRVLQSLRQSMGGSAGRTPGASSGGRASRAIGITGPSGSAYQSRIVEVRGAEVLVDIPVDHSGRQVRWSPSTPVKVALRTSGGKALSLSCRVSGYHEVNGRECLLLRRQGSAGTPATKR